MRVVRGNKIFHYVSSTMYLFNQLIHSWHSSVRTEGSYISLNIWKISASSERRMEIQRKLNLKKKIWEENFSCFIADNSTRYGSNGLLIV